VKILIADDDVASRLALAGVLQKFGHEVAAKADGIEAWIAMQQPDAPKLAVLDWEMPGLCGVDVCRRVRAMQSDCPPHIIILTSRGEKADIVAGLEAGADDYLAKPFDPSELRARIEVGRRLIELQTRLAEARNALAYEAMHDPLTGVLNRRAFAEVLSREIARERRHDHGLAIGMCDIDKFKHINDTYGHRVGDEVLRGVVRRIEASLRDHDVLGRMGGDEFAMITAYVRGKDATVPYERVRAAMAASPVATSAGSVAITISLGVKTREADEIEDELLGAADAALYRAKGEGGNRVCLARETTPPGP
jgi:two-component system cell cycle response regulator